ncbi:hypothetical protein TRFO_05946 [Tritrichomonas foetus]|uniref:Uncharacterized protein n=1 Tax=Tritrichomonas foetus TaxID=1144522 RepID=A0A1J4K6L4_9EUKA|nr:hypothetical protein TRFO_05946 [Tritrichomonas foetus]|eukprot:OHT05364.1 hypothetical protein TRFO_05946 [Tritrichomonas foetus]
MFNFNRRKKTSNGLTVILSQEEDIPLKQVLLHENLAETIRDEAQEILDYFYPNKKAGKKFNELLDWALTKDKNTEKNDYMLNRNAANILSAISHKMFKLALEDGTLDERLKTFVDSKYADSEYSDICGQYQRILIVYNRNTKYAFFKKNPDFYQKIIDHLDIVPFQTIFQEMFSEQFEIFTNNNPQQALNQLILKSGNSNEDLIFGIFQVIKYINYDGNEDAQKFIMDDKFLEQLTRIALKLTKKYVIFEAFSTLTKLFYQLDPQIAKSIVNRFNNEDFNYNSKSSNYSNYSNYGEIRENKKLREYAMFPIFWEKYINKLTDAFFQEIPVNTFFCQSYIDTFKHMPIKDRYRIVSELNLFDKIKQFKDFKNNMFIYKLTLAIAAPPCESDKPDLLDPSSSHVMCSNEWREFVLEAKEFFDGPKVRYLQQTNSDF